MLYKAELFGSKYSKPVPSVSKHAALTASVAITSEYDQAMHAKLRAHEDEEIAFIERYELELARYQDAVQKHGSIRYPGASTF